MAAGINQKNLTKLLAQMGQEMHTTDPEGNPITREQALADLLWKMALGYEEMVRDEEGNLKRVLHKPVAWAMQYIWERREGKAAAAMPDQTDGVRAADKVRALAKERLNGIAVTIAAPLLAKGPPKHVPAKG